MKAIVKLLVFLAVFASFFEIRILLEDKESLREELIRLHVVARSDSDDDQKIKLQVKDAVISFLQTHMPQELDVKGAKAYLSGHLAELETVANTVLSRCGTQDKARVSLSEEAYPMRQYDTFTLPSGVYESLQVVIGDGAGKNWWCVVFPALCTGDTQQEYKELAVGSGFSEQLINTTVREDGYAIRFFFLDCIGKLENFFHFR